MNKACWASIMVLLLVVFGGAYKFLFQGVTEQASDGRMAIKLNENEKNLVLEEMRAFLLRALSRLLLLINKKDLKQVEKSARAVGRAAQNAVPGTLMGKLPMEFKKLGVDTHNKFDLLAMDAEQLEDAAHSMNQLEELLQNCVACHASYRIELESR